MKLIKIDNERFLFKRNKKSGIHLKGMRGGDCDGCFFEIHKDYCCFQESKKLLLCEMFSEPEELQENPMYFVIDDKN